MGFSPADRCKLAAVLGLLGSPHQGERDAAALAADRLVRGRGLEWADVLGGVETSRRREVPPPPPPQYESQPAADLRACGSRPELLTPWEVAFVGDLAQMPTWTISAKQRRILGGIANKVRSAGPRRG